MQKPIFFFNDDSKLLDALRNKDEHALVELYHKNYRSISSFVINNHGTKEDAKDVLQEALVVLWEKIHNGSFEYQAKLSTFIYAIAKNIWFRRLVRHRRELSATDEELDMAADEATPLEELEENEKTLAVQKAMEQIGNPCYELLLLYYWEEQTMEEIALKLGFANADTVKSKKYQCKKALEQLIKKIIGHNNLL